MQAIRILSVVVAGLACAPVFAQNAGKKKPARPTPPANQVKGQQQLAGVNGRFGTVYTLKSGFNYAILGAKYTMEPLPAYSVLYVGRDEKLFVVQVAIKNSNPDDTPFDGSQHRLTIVDADNRTYTGYDYLLQSQPSVSFFPNVRPGQGYGQGTDLLQVGVKIPAKARIVKIMLDQGRKGRNEEVVRYYLAGATKAEAGEDGDPANKVTPLPAEFRAEGDSTGSLVASPLKARIGAFVPSGAFALRLDGVTYSTTETYNGAAPEEGKRYLIATVTARYIGTGENQMYYVISTGEQAKLVDATGEDSTFVGVRKAMRDEDPEKTFKPGDTYAFRVFFSLPKDATGKTLSLSAGDGPLFDFDLSDSK
ncbi:MAG: hypothetical protein SFU56_10030 [Capsulimonadales bacterium]|nr:hypothetical protein [Capsulimonadales bacterium]